MLSQGIHTVASNIYHDDPCETASLSNSIAKIMLKQSAQHAMLAHPRLNPNFEGNNDKKFDVGTAAHAWLLEGENAIAICEFDDWRKNEAKEQRDLAYLQGKVPLLGHQVDGIYFMAEAAKKAIANCPDLNGVTLADGKAEQTVIWKEGNTWMRSRLDWLAEKHDLIFDYKTTDIANPEAWMRAIIGNGYDMQDSFYKRGIKAVTGKTPNFVFIVQETSAPYACYFVALPPQYTDMGNDKVETAKSMWEHCMSTGVWNGYSNNIMYPDLKPWMESDWIEKKMMVEETKMQKIEREVKSGMHGIPL